MNHRSTDVAVHRLLLGSLRDLPGIPDDDWGPYVQRMSGAIARLDGDVACTLALVVRADAVIRQLLLDVLLSRPDAPSVPAIVAAASDLLDGLDDDPRERVSAPQPQAMRLEGDRP